MRARRRRAHRARPASIPGREDDCGEVELSRLWSDLAYRPRAWVFGHFHRAHQATVEGTRFVCVSDDLDSPTPHPGDLGHGGKEAPALPR